MQHTFHEIHEQLRINRFYSFFTAQHKKQYTFTGESHNFWEVMCVISGSVCVTSDDKVYNLSEGDIIFHEPLAMHKYYTTSPDTKYLVYSHDLEGDLSDFFRKKVFSLNKHQKGILSALLDYVYTRTEGKISIHAHPLHIAKENPLCCISSVTTDHASGFELVLYIYQLMMSLANEGKMTSPSRSYESEIFSSAVNYMTENLTESLSVSDVAKHINISVSSLKRIFEKCAGMGVHKYFLMLKINTATELLEQGHSVSSVAFRLGFSSQSYFSRTYKRERKATPSDIKKNKGM